MEDLFEYLNKIDNNEQINEYRTKKVDPYYDGEDDKPIVKSDDINPKDIKKLKANIGGKVVDADKAIKQIKNKKGKSAEDNGTQGLWAIDAPTGNEAPLTPEELEDDNNFDAIASAVDSEQDFFVIGEAGWGKTSVIEEVAKRAGRTVLTVYLDKAEATDLGGIPVPKTGVFGKFKKTVIDYAMPGWALYMLAHPDEDFLLFFDEMNQAAPDVQNALMPIILKKVICGIQFNNYVVGAAGNYTYENEAVSDLSKPLKSRFTMIEWEARTPEQWAAHFRWAHKKYDSIIGPEIIDECARYQEYWASPRDLTRRVYDFCALVKRKGFKTLTRKARFIKTMNDNLIYEGEDGDFKNGKERKIENAINSLADVVYDWIDNKGQITSSRSSRRQSASKGMDMIDPEFKKNLIEYLQKGYIGLHGDKYLVTLENVLCDDKNNVGGLFDVNEYHITKEVLEKIAQEMEDAGQKVKYKTIEAAIKHIKNMNRADDYILMSEEHPDGIKISNIK